MFTGRSSALRKLWINHRKQSRQGFKPWRFQFPWRPTTHSVVKYPSHQLNFTAWRQKNTRPTTHSHFIITSCIWCFYNYLVLEYNHRVPMYLFNDVFLALLSFIWKVNDKLHSGKTTPGLGPQLWNHEPHTHHMWPTFCCASGININQDIKCPCIFTVIWKLG